MFQKKAPSKKGLLKWAKTKRFWVSTLAITMALVLFVGNQGVFSALKWAFGESDPLQRIFSIIEGSTGDPQTIADYEQLANIAITQERYDEAAGYLEAAISAAGEDEAPEIIGALYTKLGSLHALRLDYDAAKNALTEAIARNEKDAQALILRAQIDIELGSYQSAVSDLEKYLSLEDRDAAIWTVMAQLYEAVGEYEKARESYGRAYALDESSIFNVLNSARNEYLLGNFQAAIDGYNAFLALEKDADGSVHFLRGVALLQLGEYENAAADLLEAIALEYTETALCYEQLSICYYALEDFEQVLTFGDKALEAGGQVTLDALYQRMGVAAMSLERYEESVAYLTQSIELSPLLEGSSYYRGVCNLALENYAQAAEDFTASIEQDFLSQFCYYNRGVCYVQLGEYESAIDDMEKTLLAENSDESLEVAAKDVLWQIAQYYLNNPEALEKDESAIDASPIQPEDMPTGDDDQALEP